MLSLRFPNLLRTRTSQPSQTEDQANQALSRHGTLSDVKLLLGAPLFASAATNIQSPEPNYIAGC